MNSIKSHLRWELEENQLHGEGIKSKKVLLGSDLNGWNETRVGEWPEGKYRGDLQESVTRKTRKVESQLLLSELRH
jgi:hypothetical protein